MKLKVEGFWVSACVFLTLVAFSMAMFFSGFSGEAPGDRGSYFEMPPELPRAEYLEAAWWMYSQRAFPSGRIPADAYRRSLDAIRLSKKDLGGVLKLADVQERWISAGPRPVYTPDSHAQSEPYSGLSRGLAPVSGRVVDVAADPGDARHWVFGAASGGIWETRDGGVTFSPRSDDFMLATGAIAFAPGDPQVVYAGLGDAAGPGFGGSGILKSEDGGTSWSLIAGSDQTFNRVAFSDIQVSPGDAEVLLAGVTPGLFGRGSFFPGTQDGGVWKSTDGGATWRRVLEGTGASDLEASSDDFNNLYAGLGEGDGAGLYRSNDNGESWDRIEGPWDFEEGGVGRVELALSPSNPNTLYVSISDAADGVGRDLELLGLWRSDDAWSPVPTFAAIPFGETTNGYGDGTVGYCGNQCWFDHEIIVDPDNASTLYAGGVTLWKCTDCADQPVWEEISRTITQIEIGMHVDQHTMTWAGSTLLVGNDGGLMSSEDKGQYWANHNSTLSLTQFYDGSIVPDDPDLILGGQQDSSSSIFTGAVWDNLPGGDGSGNFFSRQSPDRRWAYASQQLSVRRVRGAVVDTGGSEVIEDGDAARIPFIPRLEVCPSDDDVVVFGAAHLWKTEEFFSAEVPSWFENSDDLGDQVSAIAFAPSDATCRTYAFATTLGAVWVTTDGGASWTTTLGFDPDDPQRQGALPFRYITDLAFDPTDAATLYATFTGFEEDSNLPGHLYRTSNAGAGQTWEDVSPPNSNLPFNAISIDTNNPNSIYIGSDLGVWRSLDGGATWQQMGPETGMPYVPVFDIETGANGRVVAFTFGRGAYVLSPAEAPFLPERLFFAHFGKGQQGGVRLFSQLMLLNPHPELVADALVQVQNDLGVDLDLPLTPGAEVQGNGGAAGTRLAIPPRGLRTLTAAAEGAVVPGSVLVSSDSRLSGVIQFGGTIGLAGVGGDQGQPRGFLAPIERNVMEGVNTGIAVRNLGPGPINLAFLLYDSEGTFLAEADQNDFPRNGHVALFVDQLQWNAAVDLSNFTGVLAVVPAIDFQIPPIFRLAGTVLQVRDNELATLPVAPFPAGAASGGGRELYFAQFGKGAAGATELFSELLLLNLTDDVTATVQVQIRDDAGNPLTVNLNGEEVAGSTNLSIPGRGLRILTTDRGGALQAGSVRVFSNAPLAGVVLFGGSLGVAGVGSSQIAPNGFLAMMETNQAMGVNTGIAITGVTDAPVGLELELLNPDGQVVATASRTGAQALPALGHTALFVNQFTWTPAVDFSTFRGVLDVRTSAPVAATVIQTRPGQFATMPVSVR